TKGRRKTVVTNRGTWTYSYRGGDGGDGQLAGAVFDPTDPNVPSKIFSYASDGIGRRTDFAGNVGDTLNRFLQMVHPQVPKLLYVTADPAARVWINGVELNPAPDDFDGFAAVPLGHPGSAGGWVGWEVKGVIENGGDAGAFPDAVSELKGQLWFPPETENFTYDDDGNRDSSALWDYGWDGRNRLARAATRDRLSAPEGWDVEFDYDAEGRRFKKVVTRFEDGDPVERRTIWFVWDGWDLLYERHEDAFGNLLFDRKYVWGPDIADGSAGGAGGLLLTRETRGQTTRDFYPLYDGSGHIVGLSDDLGNLVAEYWYGPFGELIEATGEMADANPWRYATKYQDKETGLYYFGHRYFDSVTGQWMSREPLGENESLNLYLYAHGDPVNRVDVLGFAAYAYDSSMS
ncbi:RHS repeat-associated core domain-containing protein, partial [Haloferula sp. A504]|uniref:RHS repeat-associated core domain-containing protein n=1 Tax=Haloferula sp. A504 TaxID=3373601 RepID=UPI0031C12479|nr:RHS repeat-associated core domain-containing protein [Verrucomicrobiaceae bacterium E54]